MEENETRKEECRKRAEERVRAGESAQARIDALIARAGGPVMVVRNTQEREGKKRDNTIQAILDIADYKNGGNLTVWIRELTDTIDRLEAALYNALNERDQLLSDLNRMTNKHGSCDYCLHKNKSAAECRGCTRENDHLEWRGVPEVNDNDA